MSSPVEIANAALTKLGAPLITSFTEATPEAKTCNECYDRLRQVELRKHRWSFAIQRFQLAADVAIPLFNFQKQYSLPAGVLRVLDPDPNENTTYNRQIEGNKILTQEPAPLDVRFVMDITDCNLMDPLFRDALSARMALEMCEKMTQSNQKKMSLKDDYKDAIAEAKRINAIELPPQVAPTDDWLLTRF